MNWRPKLPWRVVVFIGVLVLAMAPAALGIALWDIEATSLVFWVPLIFAGPVIVLSFFVATTPFLEGRWLKNRGKRGGDRFSGEQESE